MGVKSKYSDWIKNRIKKFSFVENEDYIIVETKKEGNNATMKEYYITLDMAKELSMVENNPRGREARRYFIDIEKQHRNQPLLIEGKDPRFIIGGYQTQNAKLRKKLELMEMMNDKLLEENSKMVLPAPAVVPAKRGGHIVMLDFLRYEQRLDQAVTMVMEILNKAQGDQQIMKQRLHMVYPELEQNVKFEG